ncbi:hypothetical protein AAG570_010238 [Ranatra chinensis]|uniref:Serpin domain-containing protein n=1 Tax=Ranatra chinensis TaxID=642074 RepID=A0ABD0YLZ2_9HEMI
MSEEENLAGVPTTLSQAINKFAVQLYKDLSKEKSNDASNMLVSPFNLTTCLGLVYLATGGDTASQVADTLHLPPSLKDSAEDVAAEFKNIIASIDEASYKCSSGLFADTRFDVKDSFKEMVKSQLGGTCELVNFTEGDSARERINTWVKENTASKIENLLPPGLPFSDQPVKCSRFCDVAFLLYFFCKNKGIVPHREMACFKLNYDNMKCMKAG